MTQHLQINGLISEQQHGFVPKRSCSTNLLETLSLNEGANVDIIYLDFSKAFYKVCHKKLLIKLRAYGFSEFLIVWINAFLSGEAKE